MKVDGKASDALPNHLISFSTVVAAGIAFVLVVFVDYWVSTRAGDVTLLRWIKEDWLATSTRATLAAGAIVWFLIGRKTIWDALYADYSNASEFKFRSSEYPTTSGIMKVDDDEFEISTTPTEVGLVLSRPTGSSLFFPWAKVKEIRVLDQSTDLAHLQVQRRATVPLEIEIPWDLEFRDTIPTEVKYHVPAKQLEETVDRLFSRIDVSKLDE